MWDKVKALLAGSAPLVGSLLGGPAGGAVGSLVASALGVEDTPKAIESALQADPDAFLKIKQLESDERVKLRELKLQEASLDLERHKSEIADTQDARKQHKDHWMPWVLVIILAAMVSGMFAALFFGEPAPEYAQVLIMITGGVLGAFGTGVAYWLGSSQGSVTKGKQLGGGVNVR